MKNSDESHGVGAGNQLELVVVPGDYKDKLKKAFRQQLALYGSKTFSGEDLTNNVIAELEDIAFTEDEQREIVEDYKKRTCTTMVGRAKALGTRAIEAHIHGLSFQQAKGPTKKLVRHAMLTVGKGEQIRLLYANRTNIRDAVEYLKAKKALSDHRSEKTIRAYEAFLREMKDEQLEFAGDLFPDV
tara:strand:+ start:879 stop:1436 length:558 start_codon:yes stop_codon:yes gene_type:complete